MDQSCNTVEDFSVRVLSITPCQPDSPELEPDDKKMRTTLPSLGWTPEMKGQLTVRTNPNRCWMKAIVRTSHLHLMRTYSQLHHKERNSIPETSIKKIRSVYCVDAPLVALG